MSKAAKKRLAGCKDKADKIQQILNSKKSSADVVEFSNTVKFAITIIDEFTKSKSKERPQIADEGLKIERLIRDYEDLLVQLVNTQRFLRFFTSNRVRKNLDQINSQLHKEIAQVFLGMQEKRKGARKLTKKPSAKLEPEGKQSECILDDEGRHLWESSFDQTIMVDWNEFVAVLRRTIPFDDEAEKQLRYILDNSNTGFVSMYKFSDFLNGFGPLRWCVSKVQAVLNSEWFHGFLSSQEAERFLDRQQPGTFLIRFSKSKAGSFAIAYVDPTHRNSVTHTLITACPPSGFKIEEAYNRNARGRLFSTLLEVVEFYNYLLKNPFKSDLSRQSWFHGDLTSQEAEEILQLETEGTYLFRFSSKPGFLAISYVNEGIKHGLLECLPHGGYKFDNNPPVYPTLQDVIANLNDILKQPLNVLTYSNGRSQPLSLRNSQISSPTPEQPHVPSEYTNFSGLTTMLKTSTGSLLNVSATSQTQTGYAVATTGNYANVAPPPQFTSPTNSPVVTKYASVSPAPVRSAASSEYGNMPRNMPAQPVQARPSQTQARGSSQHIEYDNVDILRTGINITEYGSVMSSNNSPPPPASLGNRTGTLNSKNLPPMSEYGNMPTTGGLNLNLSGNNPSNPPPPPANYGMIPSLGVRSNPEYESSLTAANPNPSIPPTVNAQQQRMGYESSVQAVNPKAVEYGSSLSAVNTRATPVAQYHSEYGSVAPIGSEESYGAIPSPSNYQQHQQRPQSEYNPNRGHDNNYGKMPTPQQRVSYNASLSSSQSAVSSNAPPSNYGILPTNLSAQPPPRQIPPSNYGSVPSLSRPLSPESPRQGNPQITKIAPSPPLTPRMTAPQTPRPPHNSQQPQQQQVPNNYGAIPSPIPRTTTPTALPPSKSYGKIPPRSPSGSPGSPNPMRLPSVLGNSRVHPPPNEEEEPDYGGLPQFNSSNGYNVVAKSSSLDSVESDYGALPIGALSLQASGSASSISLDAFDDYGALPAVHQLDGQHPGPFDDDYNALPSLSAASGGEDPDYSGLPSVNGQRRY
eukprot:TRINITY_DN5379_c0_g1_i6.p1 TRINITY_DN5379_c0_g1~~TRINITY_DN5379_c0_g1_i6.p1  ORF type:complete len:1028 (-),score=216.85 TRINITY_DN5379_c0_g1_i6:67-3150(-)